MLLVAVWRCHDGSGEGVLRVVHCREVRIECVCRWADLIVSVRRTLDAAFFPFYLDV